MNKKYCYLTQAMVDRLGGVETIQAEFRRWGIEVEVVIIPLEYKGENKNEC